MTVQRKRGAETAWQRKSVDRISNAKAKQCVRGYALERICEDRHGRSAVRIGYGVERRGQALLRKSVVLQCKGIEQSATQGKEMFGMAEWCSAAEVQGIDKEKRDEKELF